MSSRSSPILFEIPPFRLDADFVRSYSTKKAPFGFNGLGEFVFRRTYSRVKADGTKEEWYETVERVVNGTYNMQQEWILESGLEWKPKKAQKSAQEMYRLIFSLKFCPPGRGLWAMGSPIINERKLYAALNNCAFVSTAGIHPMKKPASPFVFLMDAAMLGIGVGFDTEGAGNFIIDGVDDTKPVCVFQIPDSREGWVQALEKLLESHFCHQGKVCFDYSLLRPNGTPIKTFGGVASGPAPLSAMIENIDNLLQRRKGELISVRDIVDMMNFIGVCVVSGNVRRCLPRGTIVHTKRGLVPIEEVKKGDMARTRGGFATVKEQVVQGLQDVITVRTTLGDLRCTENHAIAVAMHPAGYIWKKAKNLVDGDCLVFVENRDDDSGVDTQFPPLSIYDKENEAVLNLPKMDTHMAWFCAAFQLQGINNTNQNDTKLQNTSIFLPNNNPFLINRCMQQFARFDCHVTSHDMLRLSKKGMPVPALVNAQSDAVACFFSIVFSDINRFDVPQFIKSGKAHVRAGYLAGLFDLRNIHAAKGAVATSMCLEFILQIQIMYASLGIATTQDVNLPRSTENYGMHALYLMGNKDRFEACVVPHIVDYGDGNYLKVDGALALQPGLMRVPFLGFGKTQKSVQTYDISVYGVHEFVAGQGLLVHNTAEIAFGDHNSEEFIGLKDYKKVPEREAYGWTSNNSVFAKVGMDYSRTAEMVCKNGEPGFAWLQNMREYSRMGAAPDHRDRRATGGNPCLEQTLEHMEMCCVRGNTRILTDTGYPKIKSVVDQRVRVFNGEKWSYVKPFLAAQGKSLWRVVLSDGSYLDVTDNHDWWVRESGESEYSKKRTNQLSKGMALQPFSVLCSNGRMYVFYMKCMFSNIHIVVM